MIEFENDPVWTPLNPKTGVPIWGVRCTLAECRKGCSDVPPIARWDAEAVQWVVAPPAPVEVTGAPVGWVVVNQYGSFQGTPFNYKASAQAHADRLDKEIAAYRPHRIMPIVDPDAACIPVPRNEEDQ